MVTAHMMPLDAIENLRQILQEGGIDVTTTNKLITEGVWHHHVL